VSVEVLSKPVERAIDGSLR